METFIVVALIIVGIWYWRKKSCSLPSAQNCGKPSPQQAKAASKPVGAKQSATQTPATAGVKIPEDSMLKRHFLSQIQAEIESQLPIKPTEATLKRHYETEIKARLERYLSTNQA
ncbi:MAG: hypothetical protein WC782_09510 [Methylococcaceae bacterium]|jgi:hypothetical protein